MTRIEAIGAAVAGFCLLGFLALLMVTSSLWFDLRNLTVSDARVGQPVAISYDREFYRDFDGSWRVLIWQQHRGSWQAYCEASGQWGYRMSKPDQKKDLAWLVDGEPRCSNLPPGVYSIEVKVTANPDSIIARSDVITSNAFEVTP